MKKLASVAIAIAALSAGIASAATYTLQSNAPGAAGPNLSVLHGIYIPHTTTEVRVANWITPNLLVTNLTGNSYLGGSFKGTDGATYVLALTLGGSSISGTTQSWSSTTGTLIGTNGVNRTITAGLMPSVLGINAAPYNSGNTKLEFGMWASYGGGFHFDVNNEVICTAAGRPGTNLPPGTAPGTGHGCPTTPTSVPLPGTLALLGLGFLGLGLRKKA